MKQVISLCALTLLLLSVVACGSREQQPLCHISGFAPDSLMEGQQVFLVPFYNATRANVDSTVVKDGKFEFYSDTLMMAKILTAFRLQLDVQPLLVVVEQGDVEVTIASVSSGRGTPQNDSLQSWKELTERYHTEDAALRSANDTAKADSVRMAYFNRTKQMAGNLKQGVLHDFLMSML